jgi:hypothetical protein
MAQTIYRIQEKWEEGRRKHEENKIYEVQGCENIQLFIFNRN